MEMSILMSKRYYLCGPMTGYPEHNVPAFKAAELTLRAKNFDIEMPIDIYNQKEGWQWGDYLAEDIRLITTKCMGMVLLPEWDRSRGAKLEIAAGLMQVLKYPEFEFRFYKNGDVSDPIHPDRIAIAWYWDWNLSSKEAQKQIA